MQRLKKEGALGVPEDATVTVGMQKVAFTFDPEKYTGKTALKPGAKATLKKIAAQVATDPSLKIAVEGHTDNVGGKDTNQALSEKRADAVKDYLVSAGIPADHVTASGKGEESPIVTNKTAAGRQQNRRVELVITQ